MKALSTSSRCCFIVFPAAVALPAAIASKILSTALAGVIAEASADGEHVIVGMHDDGVGALEERAAGIEAGLASRRAVVTRMPLSLDAGAAIVDRQNVDLVRQLSKQSIR
jgi:hypothetical protein